MLLEQFGGADGELAAAMQYSVQGLNCEDAAREDFLMDIGTEELRTDHSRASCTWARPEKPIARAAAGIRSMMRPRT